MGGTTVGAWGPPPPPWGDGEDRTGDGDATPPGGSCGAPGGATCVAPPPPAWCGVDGFGGGGAPGGPPTNGSDGGAATPDDEGGPGGAPGRDTAAAAPGGGGVGAPGGAGTEAMVGGVVRCGPPQQPQTRRCGAVPCSAVQCSTRLAAEDNTGRMGCWAHVWRLQYAPRGTGPLQTTRFKDRRDAASMHGEVDAWRSPAYGHIRYQSTPPPADLHSSTHPLRLLHSSKWHR